MEIKYERIKDNSDATSNYDVIVKYPISFAEFYRVILENDDSFRIVLHATNDTYGGWCYNKVEISHNETEDVEMFDRYMKETVVDCWANGGWGQMTYFMTFAEQEVN